MSKKKNDTSFLVQGSILAIASLVSRVIGLVYRIPLTDGESADSLIAVVQRRCAPNVTSACRQTVRTGMRTTVPR